MQQEVEVFNGWYDAASKFWTFVLGILVAGIVDWYSIVIPARNHPRDSLHMGGWDIALIIAMLAPASWLVGRLVKKDWNGVVIWVCATALAVVFQLVVVAWGRS